MMIQKYFLMFMLYSFIGWVMELIVCSIIDKKIRDRGFLIGPYCPIHGVGAIIMILLLKKYSNDIFVLFVMAVVICSILEYITSFIMEKIFKARWWDYSEKMFNINGRVCLTNGLAFGFIGVLLIYYIDPFVVRLIDGMSISVLNYTTAILAAIFAIDNIISCNIMFKIKGTLIKARKDNTQEITQIVRSILLEKSVLTKRVANAFPDVKVTIDSIRERVKKEKETLEKEIKRLTKSK